MQTFVGLVAYVSWYYPLGLWRKALEQYVPHGRSELVFLLIWSLFILFQTRSQMLMTIMPEIPTEINIGNLVFMLSLIFYHSLTPEYKITASLSIPSWPSFVMQKEPC